MIVETIKIKGKKWSVEAYKFFTILIWRWLLLWPRYSLKIKSFENALGANMT